MDRSCYNCGGSLYDGRCAWCTCNQCGRMLRDGVCLNCNSQQQFNNFSNVPDNFSTPPPSPFTCCSCGNVLQNGSCVFCGSNDSFPYDQNPNSFDYPPQPDYPSYDQRFCNNCGDSLDPSSNYCNRCTCGRCGRNIINGFCSTCAFEANNSYSNDFNSNFTNYPQNDFNLPPQNSYEQEPCFNNSFQISSNTVDLLNQFLKAQSERNAEMDARLERMAAESEVFAKKMAELDKEYEEARDPQQEEVHHLEDKLNSDDEEADSSYVYDVAPHLDYECYYCKGPLNQQHRCIQCVDKPSNIKCTMTLKGPLSTSIFNHKFLGCRVIYPEPETKFNENDFSENNAQEPGSSAEPVEIPSSESTPFIQPSESSSFSLSKNHVFDEPFFAPVEPDGFLSMGIGPQNSLPATELDEFQKSSVESPVPIQSESEENSTDKMDSVIFKEPVNDDELSAEEIRELCEDTIVENVLDSSPIPYPISDPLLSDSSNLSLDSEERNDVILDEIEKFLADDSIPTEVDEATFDPEGDILFLEQLLNEEPLPLTPPVINDEFDEKNDDDVESYSDSHNEYDEDSCDDIEEVKKVPFESSDLDDDSEDDEPEEPSNVFTHIDPSQSRFKDISENTVTTNNTFSSILSEDKIFKPGISVCVAFCELQPDILTSFNAGFYENLKKDDWKKTKKVELTMEDFYNFDFMIVIMIFLLFLAYPISSPSFHSSGNEDTIFDPGISSFKVGCPPNLLPHD